MTTVKLIAQTQITYPGALHDLGYYPDNNNQAADELAEFAGRNCYQSFGRPNPATDQNDTYLKHILEIGHESVLEHGSATFYVDASRSVLTELERHRHLSFSVVSQRYVDANRLGTHTPPIVKDLPFGDYLEAAEILDGVHIDALHGYRDLVRVFERNGHPRKKAREAARAVLPNMTSSPMVVTGNHRAWRHVIKNRYHEAADAEIQEFAGLLLKELRKIAPNIYQDIPYEPYSYNQIDWEAKFREMERLNYDMQQRIRFFEDTQDLEIE
ncbi:FAD-dependent thymidylate synthase [Nocardia sp. NPDC055002]